MLRDIEDLIFFEVGDRLLVMYSATENDKIREISYVGEIFE